MSTDVSSALVAKSDQLNGDDLIGRSMVIEITKVTNLGKGKEQPLVINYRGDEGKPWKPCKSMGRALVEAWQTTEGADWVGRKVRLFRDPNITFGPDKTGGIRISHVSHIDKTMTFQLTATRGKKKPYTVQPLREEVPASAAAPKTSSPVPKSTPTVTSTQLAADAPATTEEIEAARAVARKGSAHLVAWWESLDSTMKKVYAPIKDELKRIAEDFDAVDPNDV